MNADAGLETALQCHDICRGQLSVKHFSLKNTEATKAAHHNVSRKSGKPTVTFDEDGRERARCRSRPYN
jgi:hypothetical protein